MLLESEMETKYKDKTLIKVIRKASNKTVVDNAYEWDTCKICLDNKIDTVLSPCAHAVVCLGCRNQISICPICRQWIQSHLIPIFA